MNEGLNSEDWQQVSSKIKRANLQQLYFLITTCEEEIIKRTGQ